MEGATAPRSFEHLREHSIGLPQVLFQSITHMAPAAAVAYSIFISVPDAGQALPLSVGARADRLHLRGDRDRAAREALPVRGRPVHLRRARRSARGAGFLVAWLFILFEPLVAPFLFLEFGWAMNDVFQNEVGWHYDGQWWIWVLLMR